MNTCENFSESFSEYVEEDVHPEQRRSIDLHLAQCPSCHAAIARLQSLRTHMRALPRLKTSHDFDTLLRARLMLERKRAYAIPFFSEVMQLPRTATYAFAGLLLLLAIGMFLKKGHGSEALAKSPQHEELKVFSFLRPASNTSEKILFSLDKIRPASLQTQQDANIATLRNVPQDSLPESQATPTGSRLRTVSF